jgi:hypothetical protein
MYISGPKGLAIRSHNFAECMYIFDISALGCGMFEDVDVIALNNI